MSLLKDEYPVGVLTTQDRNTWAQAWKRLTSGNLRLLPLIVIGWVINSLNKIFKYCFFQIH